LRKRHEATGRRRIALLAATAAALWIATDAPLAERPDDRALLGPEASSSQRIIHQGEWAAQLAIVLGLSSVLSDDPDPADVFGLLCPEGAERTLDAGGRPVPAESAFHAVVDAPRGRSPGDSLRVSVTLPAPAVYMLSAEGTGPQRWAIDRRPVGNLDVSALGVAQAPAVVPLRRGPHELTAYLTHSSRVDRVELSAYRPLCIAPAAGWRADRPLTFGDQARTIVQVLGIEPRLPTSGDPILVEGEAFVIASAWGGLTNRPLAAAASSDAWVTAAGSPAEFTYRVRLEDPGVFTVEARLHGSGPQLWSIDGRHRVTAKPAKGSEQFAWTNVLTLPLRAGEHVVRALLPRDDGIDVIRLVRRKSQDADYLSLMEEAGFQGGAPAAYVTRAEAFASLSNPTFSEHAHHFLAHLVDGDVPIFLVENDSNAWHSRPLSPLLPPEL
jgi:hypothetical protein